MKYVALIFLSIVLTNFSLLAENPRPNIIWIYVEDLSPNFSYNGETLIQTPNMDKLANEGVVFQRAYVTSPVCSASRSALITGMYQTSIGAHNHRSSRGPDKIYLPEKIKTIPEYFREAGYYVSNQFLQNDNDWTRKGKEDYNFVYETDELYDGLDWKGKDEKQPFFAQIHLLGGKKRQVQLNTMVDPDNVVLPPHYPNDPVLRRDWAQYLNSVKNVDNHIEVIFDRLREENLLENTVVFFMSDHGISHARGKQFCYEEGAHIPMVVWGQKYVGQEVREELISHIDVAATSMYFAGIKTPDHLEARPLFGKDAIPREFVVTATDRCDETVEHIRSVRKGDYLYIRNYLHKRPLLKPNAYKDAKEFMIRMRELHKAERLNSLQERILFADERPYEELYNISLDKNQYINLATDKNMQKELEEMRAILDEWEVNTNDQGRTLESHEVYNREMNYLIKDVDHTRLPNRANVLRENVAIMNKWAAEGK